MWRSSGAGLLRRAAGAAGAGGGAGGVSAAATLLAARRAGPAAAAVASSVAVGGVRGLASDVSLLSLSELGDNAGAKQARKRVGRGIGSGLGKTSGRGMNGQKKRASVNIPRGFEGGQTPLHRRLPKRGFKNLWATPMTPLHVGEVQNWIDMGRLQVPDGRMLTMKDLVDAGMVKATKVKHGIKLLGHGAENVRTPFHLEVSRASASAIEAVEKAGGTITCVHFNRLALRALLKPETFLQKALGTAALAGTESAAEGEGGEEHDLEITEEQLSRILPRRARPPPKLMPFYLDYDRRGYLSPEVQLRNRALFGGRVTSEPLPPLPLAAAAAQQQPKA